MVRGLRVLVPREGAHRARAVHERVPQMRALAAHLEVHQVRPRVDAPHADEACEGVPEMQEHLLEQGEDAQEDMI